MFLFRLINCQPPTSASRCTSRSNSNVSFSKPRTHLLLSCHTFTLLQCVNSFIHKSLLSTDYGEGTVLGSLCLSGGCQKDQQQSQTWRRQRGSWYQLEFRVLCGFLEDVVGQVPVTHQCDKMTPPHTQSWRSKEKHFFLQLLPSPGTTVPRASGPKDSRDIFWFPVVSLVPHTVCQFHGNESHRVWLQSPLPSTPFPYLAACKYLLLPRKPSPPRGMRMLSDTVGRPSAISRTEAILFTKQASVLKQEKKKRRKKRGKKGCYRLKHINKVQCVNLRFWFKQISCKEIHRRGLEIDCTAMWMHLVHLKHV